MNKKFLVVTDLHIGTLQEVKCTIPIGYENLILLGDNVDLKRCLKKDLRVLKQQILKLFNLKVPYVCSNHEGAWGLLEFHIDEETSTLFCHGHQLKSNYEKYKEDCRTAWEGSGYLMHVLTGLANKLIHIVPFGKDDAKRAISLAKKYGCTTIVCGHYHTSYDQVVDGVRIVICDKGITEVIV